jgi:hypothetical protein
MAFLIKDRVLETCSSPGTGAATLLGAVTGYQSFSTAFSSTNGTTTYYCIADQGGANWEVGLGTWNTGNTLTRTTVIASSNAGATVNFASGTQNIFCTYPAEYALYSGGPLGTPSSGTVTNLTGTASININGTVGATTQNTGAFTTVTANATTSGTASTGAFSYGTLSYTDVNHILTMQASQNNYVQMEIQNTNTGTAASADVIVSNNNTTASTYYGDFGMNSSGWTGTPGTNSFGSPNTVYLTATTGDLLLGTTTANTIRFAVNSGADSVQINGTTGIVSFPTTTAITLPAGTTAQEPTGVQGMLRFNTTTSQFEGYNGSAWASVGGAAISNDTATATTVYPLFSHATSGTALTVYTSNANYLYTPSTGLLQAPNVASTNGITINGKTISSNVTIATGQNGFSVGPTTLNSGVTVTIASGSRWVEI